MPQNRGVNPMQPIIGITAFFLLVIFILGILNYMNLFRLDFYIPSLSFLPHLQNKTPALNPYQKPVVYNYNQAIPEKTLPEFIRQVIKPAFLPSNFTIVHKLNENNQTTDTDYTYGTAWKSVDAEFHGFYHFNIGTNNRMDSQVEIFLFPGTDKTTDGKGLISKYLIKDGSQANCKVIDSGIGLEVCEVFYADFFGTKHGFGSIINIQNADRKHEDIVFTCEIPLESIHSEWKSCIQQYSTTGIKGQ